MLKKLIKYEFKSVSRILIPVLWGTLALALITSLLFTMNFRLLGSGNELTVANRVFTTLLTTLLVFSIIAIIASFFVVWFILMQRYYRNFFGDEGYLTFTLPTEVHQQLTAKLISGFVWMLLSWITIFISAFLLISFGTADNGQIINTEIFTAISDGIRDAVDYIGTSNAVAYLIELIALVFVELAAQMMVFYLSITIGCIIAKKHKILGSIGAYFGVNTVTGIFANVAVILIFSTSDLEKLNDPATIYNASHWMFISFIIFYLLMGVASFLVSNRLLKKNLNLE